MSLFPSAEVTGVDYQAPLLMWVLGIRTRAFVPGQQTLDSLSHLHSPPKSHFSKTVPLIKSDCTKLFHLITAVTGICLRPPGVSPTKLFLGVSLKWS